jgi:hypothetical protein
MTFVISRLVELLQPERSDWDWVLSAGKVQDPDTVACL